MVALIVGALVADSIGGPVALDPNLGDSDCAPPRWERGLAIARAGAILTLVAACRLLEPEWSPRHLHLMAEDALRVADVPLLSVRLHAPTGCADRTVWSPQGQSGATGAGGTARRIRIAARAA